MSRIVEDFAEGWFAKRRYQDGTILALHKLQMELESTDSQS